MNSRINTLDLSSPAGPNAGFVRIWNARNLEMLKIVELDQEADSCQCELTSRHGHLQLLTMQLRTCTLYT